MSRLPRYVTLIALCLMSCKPVMISRAAAFEADRMLRHMADGARHYFDDSTHPFGGDSGPPWYRGGEPVPDEERVFPGGASYRFETRAAPPVKAQPYTWAGPRNELERAVLEALGEPLKGDTLHWQYVYATGPGTGADAELTIRAVGDFGQPDNDHTLEVRISYDPSNHETVQSPILLAHELE